MAGVTVLQRGSTNGTQTDEEGKYTLTVSLATHTIDFSFVSYSKRSMVITTLDGKDRELNVALAEEAKDLDIVVVTGSKYEKKLGEEVVSVEVLKSSVIIQNSAKLEEALNKVPGVNMLGKTISIRGGAGFSDATGNRVLGLLDEMPIISPENGSIRWETMPIEALEQIEIIKGSSSALYGSSALNGVLNMRTINPKPEMVNKVVLSYGFYDQPKNKNWSWWWRKNHITAKGDTVHKVKYRMYGGGQFLHAKQYGDFGVVLSGAYQQDAGFRQSNDYKRVRLLGKLRYTPKKIPALTTGLNFTFFSENLKDFFTGLGLDSLTYIPAQVAVNSGRTVSVDPYINYYDQKDNKHSLKFRIYNIEFNSTTGDSSRALQFYYDYSYMKNFRKINLIVTTGTNGYYSSIRGKTFGAFVPNINDNKYFNTRKVWNFAAFIQAEKKFFNRLTLSGGLRFEVAQLDTQIVKNRLPFINMLSRKKEILSPVTPLFRFGLNYQATQGTYIRASFGQGFRFPSLAEKFVYTVRSGAQVFPNPELKPENGWSAEIGIKQGVKVSKWVAYFDVSGYIMQYHDMIEFKSYDDVYNDPNIIVLGIPFRAYNVENARIMGVEASAVANGSIFGVPFNFIIGYNFLDPRNMDYRKPDSAMMASGDTFATPLLKYRSQHNAKADVQANYKGFTFGVGVLYVSHVKEIDKGAIGALRVVKDFRATHNKGFVTMDIRAGYTYKEKFSFMFICKNILNTEYTLRPALIEAPRSYTFQTTYNF